MLFVMSHAETKAVTFRIEKNRWERLVKCAEQIGVGQIVLAKVGIDMVCARVERTGKLEIAATLKQRKRKAP